MGKKMKLLSLLKNTQLKSSSSSSSFSSWPWPSCHQPRTLSLRANNDIFKTINSAYLDATMDLLESSESFFTVSPQSASFSTASDDSTLKGDSIETVIRDLRSDRLFFEPEQTSSILEAKAGTLPFKDSVVLSLDSHDPCLDFRKSMEEMVEAHGVKDWEGLEELLCSYLRVNGTTNHGYIIGAFIDLLAGLAFAASSSSSITSSSSHSPSTPLSFYSSSSMSSSSSTRCVSSLEVEEEVDTPSSSLLLEQVKEDIKQEDEASCSFSN